MTLHPQIDSGHRPPPSVTRPRGHQPASVQTQPGRSIQNTTPAPHEITQVFIFSRSEAALITEEDKSSLVFQQKRSFLHAIRRICEISRRQRVALPPCGTHGTAALFTSCWSHDTRPPLITDSHLNTLCAATCEAPPPQDVKKQRLCQYEDILDEHGR